MWTRSSVIIMRKTYPLTRDYYCLSHSQTVELLIQPVITAHLSTHYPDMHPLTTYTCINSLPTHPSTHDIQTLDDQHGEKYPRRMAGTLAMSNYQLCFFPSEKQDAFPPVAFSWFRIPLGLIASITVIKVWPLRVNATELYVDDTLLWMRR